MSGWYLSGKQGLLARTIANSANVCILGVNEDYMFDETHTSLAPTVGFELLSETLLAGVTFTNGVLDAADVTWPNAGEGVVDRSLVLKGALIYFKDGSTVTLLCYIDSASVGLPQTLTGVDVTASFDPRGICKL